MKAESRSEVVERQIALLREAHTRGAELVVIDPYRTPTAEQADLHLMVKPGTDGALACAVINVMLAEDLADRDYLARYTDWDAEIEAHFAQRTPEWAAEITGVPVDQIVEFARLYGGTKRTFIRASHGFSRQRNGSVNMHAVLCLPSVTGAWAGEGGGKGRGGRPSLRGCGCGSACVPLCRDHLPSSEGGARTAISPCRCC